MFDTLKFYQTLVAGGYTEAQAKAVTKATLVAMQEHGAYLEAHSERAAFERALKTTVFDPKWWLKIIGVSLILVALLLP